MSKIQLIIFDLDGVLVETKQIHFMALNQALREYNPKYEITWKEHLAKYDGLKTNQKLRLLSKEKDLPLHSYKHISQKKQEYTRGFIEYLKPQDHIKNCLFNLKFAQYELSCCTNSIRQTLDIMLNKLDIIKFFDTTRSNEDVEFGKPHPQMYWEVMSKLGHLPEETLIIEDSPIGLLGANRSGAHVMRVKGPSEVTYDNIMKKIDQIEYGNMSIIPKWKDDKLNVLIPMAGAGSRFEQAGYTFPKPLIEVRGKPMVQLVVENLNIDARFIYIVRKEHRKKYNLDTLLNLITPGCIVIDVDKKTEGAACTTLLAEQYIRDGKLLIANSDQIVEWNSNEFFYKMNETNAFGGIVTFEATHPKWSFVKVDDEGFVTEVAEKNPISNQATVGIYYWKDGRDYIMYAKDMIDKKKKVNGEFYVAPVFQEAIDDHKLVRTFQIDKMWGIGTPEDLKYYLENA